jgi:predicted enzyme related to lactoylglutathione lyase
MIGGMLLNVSSPQPGQPTADAYPGPHYGLDHFGLETHDLDAALERLGGKGVEVVGPPVQAPDGSRSITAMGPDQVRVEIVQPPAYG